MQGMKPEWLQTRLYGAFEGMAHSYDNLAALGSIPSEESVGVSENIGCVHTVCGDAARGMVEALLKEGVLSNERLNPASSTATNEERLGWPPMVYLYAGRVHPRTPQEAAFVVGGYANLDGESFEDGRRGGVTPFDSGGVASSRSWLPWKAHAKSMREYVEAHDLHDLGKWREYFALFLEHFFDHPRDYWDHPPCKPIDGCDFAGATDLPENAWMDWTFELHLNGSVPIADAGVIYLTASLAEYIQQNAMKFPMVASLSGRLNSVAHPRRLQEECESGIKLACGV